VDGKFYTSGGVSAYIYDPTVIQHGVVDPGAARHDHKMSDGSD
jgi:hypothetical protein